MIRSVAVLVAGILLSRPGIPKPEAHRYASVLAEVAAVRGFDPLIAVAIIHFETQWRPSLISADGEDFGLGQIRARWASACRDDADPVNAPSEGCQRLKASLLDGATNLRRMGAIISANIEFCAKKTGSGKLERWLSGYQGYGDPDRGRYCEPGAKTRIVIDYYKQLVAKLAAPPKRLAKPKSRRSAPPSHGPEPMRTISSKEEKSRPKPKAVSQKDAPKKAGGKKRGRASSMRASSRGAVTKRPSGKKSLPKRAATE